MPLAKSYLRCSLKDLCGQSWIMSWWRGLVHLPKDYEVTLGGVSSLLGYEYFYSL